MANASVSLKTIDFFCSAGGMSEGFEKAGIDVIAGIDIDPNCKETYEKNHPNSKFILKDIRKMKTNYFLKEMNIQKHDDGLIMIGCSPCQHWTIINTEKGKSEPSKNLLLDFTRFVRYYKPGYIVIENVPGIELKPEESGLKNFLNFLDNNNYKYDKDVMDMSKYGVPQKRVRFVLLATRNDNKIYLPNKARKIKTLKDIIKKLPGIKAGGQDKTKKLHRSQSLAEKNKKRLRLTPKNGGTRMAWKDNPELQIEAYKGKDNIFRDVYGRMRWDKPASTITTRFNSISNGRFGHPTQNRAVSLLEGALLQTFRESYYFLGKTDSIIAKHIGNAVPPSFAKQLANRIRSHYEDVPSGLIISHICCAHKSKLRSGNPGRQAICI
jgi:DNA (cytosine-5)-methyltransferase 1